MKHLLPPFLHDALQKLIYKNKVKYTPAWHTIKGGILKGRNIFIDPDAGEWQKEMIDGTWDAFMFNYIKTLDLQGKVVYDIGAHIGYYAMTIALLADSPGMVYAFEPNRFNVERIGINLSGNKDLAERIRIYEAAVSDRVGTAQFYFLRDVESGASSGSFVSEAHTYYEKKQAYLNSFEIAEVKTYSLDGIAPLIGNGIRPDIIKIDVEGAEGSVLEGARNTLAIYKPLLLIEVHSIYNMLKVCEILGALNYKIMLLKEESDGRCFLAASCSQITT